MQDRWINLLLCLVVYCCTRISAATCGNGVVGDKLCPTPTHCCSQYGWCNTGAEFCGSGCQGGPCWTATTTRRTSTPTATPTAGCGNGVIGNGICPKSSDCCSKFGYCGNTTVHCSMDCQGGTSCLATRRRKPKVAAFGSDWFQSCSCGRTIQCSAMHSPLEYLDKDVATGRNCTFINCPQISAIGSCLITIEHVQFLNSSSFTARKQWGGAIHMETESVLLVNDSYFFNCSTPFGGGAIFGWEAHARLNNVTIVKGLSLNDQKKMRGGGIWWQSGHLNMTQVYIRSSVITDSSIDGGALALENAGALGFWNGGSAEGSFPNAIYLNTVSSFVMTNVNITVPTDADIGNGAGSAIYADGSVNMELYNVRITSTSLVGCFYLWKSTAIITNSWFEGCKNHGMTMGGGSGGALSIGGARSRATIRDTVFTGNTAAKGGAVSVNDQAILTLENTFIFNSSAVEYGGGVVASQGSQVFCRKSTFFRKGLADLGGAIYIDATSFLDISNCNITESQAIHGGGIYLLGTLAVGTNTTNIFNYNEASAYGGAFLGLGTSRSNLVNIISANNTAGFCGGGIALRDQAGANIYSSLDLYGNSASKGGQLCLLQANASNVNVVSSPKITGSVWVESSVNIDLIKNLTQNSGENSTFRSPTVQVAWKNPPERIIINQAQPIPDLFIQALDLFGNQVLDQSILGAANPVVVKIVEANNSIIIGRNTDVFYSKSMLLFSGLRMEKPGNYTLRAQLMGRRSLDKSLKVPELVVVVQDCPADSVYMPKLSKCIPYEPIHPTARYVVAIASALSAAITLLSAYKIIQFRTVPLVKANSFIFIVVICGGAFLSLLSPLARIVYYSTECTIAAWLNSIGFTIIFTAMLLKTARILHIFSGVIRENASLAKTKPMTDLQMMKIIVASVLCTVLFLVAWTLFDPPHPRTDLVLNSFITVDKCYMSVYSTASVVTRVVIELIMVVLAYEVRNVPSSFNESKMIAVSMYNWIIFGGIISLVASFFVPSPTLSFILEQISIILPNLTTVVVLATYKIYICMTDKKRANNLEFSAVTPRRTPSPGHAATPGSLGMTANTPNSNSKNTAKTGSTKDTHKEKRSSKGFQAQSWLSTVGSENPSKRPAANSLPKSSPLSTKNDSHGDSANKSTGSLPKRSLINYNQVKKSDPKLAKDPSKNA